MKYWEKGKNVFRVSGNFVMSLDYIYETSTTNKTERKFLFERRRGVRSSKIPHEDNIPNFITKGFTI